MNVLREFTETKSMTNPAAPVSLEQFELLREYLDRDCQMHLSAPHRCWSLDAGKLMAALEHAGIAVDSDDAGGTLLDRRRNASGH